MYINEARITEFWLENFHLTVSKQNVSKTKQSAN